MSDETTQALICSICHEDLNPTVEDLQAISICGHVFHELCLQQRLEYCSKGKKQCPICKQTCAASNVSRLYFQSAGDSNDSNPSQKPQTHKEDSRELKLEVRRLERKVNTLNSALESREDDITNVSNELCVCKEQLKKEASLKNETLEHTLTIHRKLNLKTQELSETEKECINLQNGNMDLAKELAALKLVSDLNLEEGEIVKLASLGTKPHSEESVDIIKKSLGARGELYKDLMVKCNNLARNVARSHEQLEKAKEQIEELEKLKVNPLQERFFISNFCLTDNLTCVTYQKKIQNLETAKEMKVIKEPVIRLGKTKRLRVCENISESNKKDGVSSYISIDDDDAPKVSVSFKFSSNDSVPQGTKSAKTGASYISKNVHETSESGQDKPLFNIAKEASSPAVNPQEGNNAVC
ncbi:putative chromatin regulator PHD family [Helianthus annuus]|nr:putative chromatin regulator PHD family [Helianthus annuus]